MRADVFEHAGGHGFQAQGGFVDISITIGAVGFWFKRVFGDALFKQLAALAVMQHGDIDFVIVLEFPGMGFLPFRMDIGGERVWHLGGVIHFFAAADGVYPDRIVVGADRFVDGGADIFAHGFFFRFSAFVVKPGVVGADADGLHHFAVFGKQRVRIEVAVIRDVFGQVARVGLCAGERGSFLFLFQ